MICSLTCSLSSLCSASTSILGDEMRPQLHDASLTVTSLFRDLQRKISSPSLSTVAVMLHAKWRLLSIVISRSPWIPPQMTIKNRISKKFISVVSYNYRNSASSHNDDSRSLKRNAACRFYAEYKETIDFPILVRGPPNLHSVPAIKDKLQTGNEIRLGVNSNAGEQFNSFLL